MKMLCTFETYITEGDFVMTVPMPVIIRGRILRRFRKVGAIGQNNAKTLIELDMEKFPFTAPGAKHMFEILQRRGKIQNEGDKYYLSK